ncbi:DUF2177 family protein [Atopobacter phocae]|uniref:DUF2177 family protein n=1 Tax=Atopobacter phocae TaxID=136492 RepID=UPI0004711D64|nr:DUF2177 family protein [Atopobacter phocae]
MHYIRAYIITFIVFFAIDIVWLVFIANNLYRNNIGHLMAEKTNWIAAIIFYLIFIAGLVFFAIHPAIEKESWQYALLAGGFFGLLCYSTFDLTNLATLKDWPLNVTLIDITWGTFINAITAWISFYLLNWFK